MSKTEDHKTIKGTVKEIFFPLGSRRWLIGKMVKKTIVSPRLMFSMLSMENIKKFVGYFGKLSPSELADKVDRHAPDVQPGPSLELLQQEAGIDACEPIDFTNSQKLVVSIVIPVYNQFSYTYNCLKSIKNNSGDVSYEIIIADDCSTDDVKRLDDIIHGANIIHNTENLRFLLNCNNAAAQAKGKYILFLNNDTQVQEGWLSALVDLIESDDNIGMVGSKLVYPDGSLQEAGGILWSDASAWNYGNKADADRPEYNYVKDVDYISGAAIMIKTSLWQEIGGFDERYIPAYCEDSDLAFEVRKHGYRVVYQPKSVVVHFEGVSNGTNVNAGIKKYQVDNARKFYEKWRDILIEEHFPNAVNVFQARDRSRNKKTVVVIDHYVPTYDKDAGSRNVYQYTRCLVKLGYNVKLIGDNFFKSEPYTSVFEAMGVEVLVGNYYFQNWKAWFRENKEHIDFVWMNRPHISIKYIDFIKKETQAKVIYHVHDLHFVREEKEYKITGDEAFRKESEKWKPIELSLMNKADVNITVSADEQKVMNNLIPGEKAMVMPIFAYEEPTVAAAHEPRQKENILFVGGFNHRPNEDGVLWFMEKIWPVFKEHNPETKFTIAGSNPTDKVKSLASDDVTITGYISDEELAELYATCRVCVLPLRFGAGVKGKLIEAMHNGIGIVSTNIGIEGLPGIENCIIGKDEEQEFAQELIRIYNDADYLEEKKHLYSQYMKDNFSMEILQKKLKNIFS